MKRILSIITISLLLGSIGYCQDQSLQLAIKSDRQVYEVGEEVKFTVTFKNNGLVGLRFYFVDAEGSGWVGLALADFLAVGNQKGEDCDYWYYYGPNIDFFGPMSEKENYYLLKPNEEKSFIVSARLSGRKATCHMHESYPSTRECEGIFLDIGWYNLFLGPEGLYNICLKYPAEKIKEDFHKAVEPNTPMFWGYDNVFLQSITSNVAVVEIVGKNKGERK